MLFDNSKNAGIFSRGATRSKGNPQMSQIGADKEHKKRSGEGGEGDDDLLKKIPALIKLVFRT